MMLDVLPMSPVFSVTYVSERSTTAKNWVKSRNVVKVETSLSDSEYAGYAESSCKRGLCRDFVLPLFSTNTRNGDGNE
jgi:hypothetical protein